MSAALPSSEVASDFLDSLQDLSMNNRYEITNLTIIAKENTEHAMAISRVLENHIRTTPPLRKLPALYVLDSIVKNVGTPYTIYLGRNLFSTFMDAYTLVDAQTRKSMEAMLKTWKEPVPGAMESRPVFSADVTRVIESALIKARTAAVQQQQIQARSQRQFHSLPSRPNMPPSAQWRNTPTPPPNVYGIAPPPGPDGYSNQAAGGPLHSYTPQQAPPFLPPQYAQHNGPVSSVPGLSGYAPPPVDTLNADLDRLIQSAREEFANNMYDPGIQQKLKALLDLQTILQSQQLPPEQRQMIRAQVSQLTGVPIPPPSQPNVQPGYMSTLPPQHDLSQLLQPPPQFLPAHPTPPPPTIPTASLAQLLAGLPGQQNGTPVPPLNYHPQPNGANALPMAKSDSQTGVQAAENPLIASLRAAGILTGTPTPPPIPAVAAKSAHVRSLSEILASTIPAGQPRGPLSELKNDVKLTAASLKIPRPHLVSALYENMPSQCSMCGRRFGVTEGEKQRKGRHLDWHFRTNQRLQDAAKRPQNRSYYIGELEWIRYREVDSANEEADAGPVNGEAHTGGSSTAGGDSKTDNVPYLKAPSDPALANQPCPVCQEKFEAVWHEAVQDWVWLDAIRVGDRIYHASCYSEVNKDHMHEPPPQPQTVSQIGKRSTPDPTVLGKRKAEDEAGTEFKAKVKVEAA